MVGARRSVASMVGATIVDGLEMRAATDDRGNRGQQSKLGNFVINIKDLVKATICIT
jgi:hypothetical protein